MIRYLICRDIAMAHQAKILDRESLDELPKEKEKELSVANFVKGSALAVAGLFHYVVFGFPSPKAGRGLREARGEG